MANLILERAKRSPYIFLVPEYLRENEDFLVFFYLLHSEFGITMDNIKRFTDLVNPDKVPIRFLESLGSYFNFKYLPNATDDFNREALMRMRPIWEQRGTKHSIIQAATHGDNDGWVGGDLFIPEYPISDRVAELEIPRRDIFRHSISHFSGSHKYAYTDHYMPGILLLRLVYLDEEVRRKIYATTPAGLKYIFEIMLDFYPNMPIDPDEVGQWNELSLFKKFRVWPKDDVERKQANSDIDFLYSMHIKVEEDDREKLYTLIHSDDRVIVPNHSGRMGGCTNSILFDRHLEIGMGASMLHTPLLKHPFGVVNMIDANFPSDDIFLHNISSMSGSKVYPSEKTFQVLKVADESQYIKSGTGEYLDIVGRRTAEHVYSRSLDNSIGDFWIYGEDPHLGDIDLSPVIERIITPKDCTYWTPYVGELKPWSHRSPFYSPDFEYDTPTPVCNIRGKIDFSWVHEKPITPGDQLYGQKYIGESKPSDYRDNFRQHGFEFKKEPEGQIPGDSIIPIHREKDIWPQDSLYDMTYVGDMKPSDFRDIFYSTSIEIEGGRDKPYKDTSFKHNVSEHSGKHHLSDL